MAKEASSYDVQIRTVYLRAPCQIGVGRGKWRLAAKLLESGSKWPLCRPHLCCLRGVRLCYNSRGQITTWMRTRAFVARLDAIFRKAHRCSKRPGKVAVYRATSQGFSQRPTPPVRFTLSLTGSFGNKRVPACASAATPCFVARGI